MSLSPGTSIGPYEISGVLGAGGMGEVYRARDSRLKRDVAIKVLPASFADDPNRVTRLQREAEILASLNHPNIAQIYGLEEAPSTGSGQVGTHALVMELVEGPTLADRLAHGSIPLDEALPIAKQIAEALEAAHEQGVIHRDLKPANIKVRPDGTVKVLDFGLAKAMETTDGSPAVSHSPTITTPAMTRIGMILGTAAYMSPEQARGGQVEKRADVWAFGVILYEMLSGRRLFDEPTVSETLAAVLKGELKLDALPRDTPAAVTRLIGRCLTRDWRRRLRDIGEARITIEDVLAHPETPGAPDTPAIAQQPLWRRSLPWAIALLALVTAALAIWGPWRSASARAGLTRLSTDFGSNIQAAATGGTVNLALSPNGQLLVLVGTSRPGDRNRLFVRPLNQLEASLLPGTEGARNPFFSPDSQWIGFFADGKLKKIPVRGGAAIVLCEAPDDRGGSWTDDGWIVFTPTAGESPLVRVRSDGGTPERITTLTDGEITHRWPQVLPGGRAVIYTAHVSTGNYEQARIVAQSLDGSTRVVVHRGGYYAQYLPAGYLLYISQQKLFAAPFDASRFELTDQAVPLLSDVGFSQGTGAAQFAFSQTGALVYLPGGNVSSEPINWIGRDGKSEPLRAAAAAYDTFRFSPDGERLAITIRDQQPDIWVYDWRREILNRVTSHDALDAEPVWTPDGRRVAFRSARDGVDNMFWQRVDETVAPERLMSSKSPQFPTSWHPNGKLLAFLQFGAKTGLDIWILPVEGDEVSGWKPGTPYVYLAGPLDQREAVFSPDGRWLAYQSDESGRSEVYVRPFPGPGSRSQVSTAGGLAPRWSRSGMELVFLSGDQKLMIAGYTIQGDVFRADKPRLWSDSAFAAFDLHPDGQRVAAIAAVQSPSSSSYGKFVFVLNVEEELRRLASPDR